MYERICRSCKRVSECHVPFSPSPSLSLSHKSVLTAKTRKGVHIVVGTPGRVFDMINRRALKTDNVKIFCLDEADEMLSRGFKDQIYEVFQHLPQETQVVLLSATMPADVLEVTKKFMRDPIRILVKRDELTLEGIKQFYIGTLPFAKQIDSF